MKIVAVLPCRGRIAQTLDLIPRLRQTAGMAFDLVCVVNGDRDCEIALQGAPARVLVNAENLGYWRAMQQGVSADAAANLVVNLANDLLPGREWLRRAYEAHCAQYADEGLIGFNDGIHTGRHAAHFLINRSLLEKWYGADLFPLMYKHEFGDAEITARAMSEKRFAVANWAVLYHNHPYTGGNDDAVYAEGRAHRDDDYNLFEKRKAAGWTG